MPPAVVAAGIGGLTTLGGALIGSSSQNKALKAQQQGNNQALQYQRERDSAADKRYERDYADWQRRQAAKDATRRAIAKHYGIDLPEAAPMPAQPQQPAPGAAPIPGQVHGGVPGGGAYRLREAPGPAPAPMQAAPFPAAGLARDLSQGLQAGTVPTSPGGSLMDAGGAPPTAPSPAAPELSSWNDWNRYANLS